MIDANEKQVHGAYYLVLGLIAAWLLLSLAWVNMEFDDGYATIANSQHFLGISSGYFWQRGPLIAWLLMPAEAVANGLGLRPLDVRPHHVVMVLIHLGYLFGVWRLLVSHFGARASVLCAFVAAVPSFLFFSYAPFISHDLFPGLLALYMLKLGHDFMLEQSWRRWLALVVLGTALALVKHTYALVWIAVFLANGVVALWMEPLRRKLVRPLLALAAGALTTGVLTWLIFAIVLRNSFGATPFLLGPWRQIQLIVSHVSDAGVISELIYQPLYFRNLAAYGLLAMALVLPGLYFSLRRGARLQRVVAIAWLVLFAAMQFIQFKEVRYLGYLAPMTAFVIIPAITALVNLRRAYVWLLVALFAFDLFAIVGEAARLRSPYYREEITGFFASLPSKAELDAPLVMTFPLSFVSPEPYAFHRDRFHRITNLIGDQVRFLHGYDEQSMRVVEVEEKLDLPLVPPGSRLFFVNDVATRGPPFRADNRPGLEATFAQFLAVAEMVELERVGDEYRLLRQTSQPVALFKAAGVTAGPLYSLAAFKVEDVRRLRGLKDTPERLRLLGFRIQNFCNIGGCRGY